MSKQTKSRHPDSNQRVSGTLQGVNPEFRTSPARLEQAIRPRSDEWLQCYRVWKVISSDVSASYEKWDQSCRCDSVSFLLSVQAVLKKKCLLTFGLDCKSLGADKRPKLTALSNAAVLFQHRRRGPRRSVAGDNEGNPSGNCFCFPCCFETVLNLMSADGDKRKP